VGNYPIAVAVDPTTHLAYVVNSGDDTLSEISGTSVVATSGVGNYPQGVTVDPTTDVAYVTNYGDDTVSEIPVARPTSTVVESAQNPTSYGQTVNVTVTPGASGVATITDGGVYEYSVTVHDGRGTIPAQLLPPGQYSLQASFIPSNPALWTESASSVDNLTIDQAPTNVDVTTTGSGGPGSPVQLVATITSTELAGLPTSGGVEFQFSAGTPPIRCNDERVSAGATPGSRAAICSLGTNPVAGVYAGTATYLGDSNHLGATSPSFSFSVSA
jgi:DNA-binding beta-propeller fold protein YncE